MFENLLWIDYIPINSSIIFFIKMLKVNNIKNFVFVLKPVLVKIFVLNLQQIQGLI